MITDDEAKRLVREMFDDYALDPYPASNDSPEVALRDWCGWKDNGEADPLDDEAEG